jgi:hypothetical protein
VYARRELRATIAHHRHHLPIRAERDPAHTPCAIGGGSGWPFPSCEAAATNARSRQLVAFSPPWVGKFPPESRV